MMNLSDKIPNLFLIGAAKCATTSVHSVLGKHPDIFMSEPKEPNFFARSDYNNLWHWYLSLFEQLGEDPLYFGESSPFYSNTFLNPDIAKRIYEFNPNAKIIYIVRNPLKRLQSVFVQGLSTGHWMEDKIGSRLNIIHKKMPLTFSEAIFHYESFIDETRYFSNISKYYEFFPKENIKLMFYEDLFDNPTIFYTDLFEFLGVSQFQDISIFSKKLNSGSLKRMVRPSFQRLPINMQVFLRRVTPPVIFKIIRTKRINNPKFNSKLKEKVITELKDEISQILMLGNKPADFWKF